MTIKNSIKPMKILLTEMKRMKQQGNKYHFLQIYLKLSNSLFFKKRMDNILVKNLGEETKKIFQESLQ